MIAGMPGSPVTSHGMSLPHPGFPFKHPDDWACPKCMDHNFASRYLLIPLPIDIHYYQATILKALL
jgi:hypothetical protein